MMSDLGRFVCLAHNHTNQVEEVECSAGFQLDRAEQRIEELEAELKYAISIMVAEQDSLNPDQLSYLMSARQALGGDDDTD